jgi:hypothetical protein
MSEPVLARVEATPSTITPTGVEENRTAVITYELREDATVSLWLRDDRGRTFPFRRDERRPAGSYSATFDGTYAPADDPLSRWSLPDGRYRFTVRATTAGGEVIVGG